MQSTGARRALPQRREGLLTYLIRHKYMYLMLVPAVVYYVVFCYVPMFGASIAFKKFNPMVGIWGSEWVGLKYFSQLFSLNKFYQVFWTTLSISFVRLVWGFPFPILIALLLNELRTPRLKRSIQTAVYVPQFISWVVLGGILTNLLSADSGIVNGVIKALGFQPVGFLTDERYFIPTMVVSMIWKTFGWNTIIYLAALTSVDPQLYEAAIVDGAGRFKRILHVTLPCLIPTIVIMLILRTGTIMDAGFDQVYNMYNNSVRSVAEILDTYIYEKGIIDTKYSYTTAIGLFKSVIGLGMVLLTDRLAKGLGQQGIA